MKLNEKKFYELAKANNFESADITSRENSALSVSVFHGQVDSLNSDSSFVLIARGIYNGKMGSVSTEKIDKNTPEFLVNSIKRAASIIENDDPVLMFKGSEKYHKKNIFNEDVFAKDIHEKIDICLEIEKKLKAYDKRINEVVSVGYSESYTNVKKSNSYGLKLSQKTSVYTYYAEISAKAGDEIRTGYKVFVSFDPNEFNIDEFVEKVAKDALSKLGSVQCKSGKYPVVFNPETTSILLQYLISSLDAENIQKHTSLFEGKLNQQVLSKKLTVIEDPLKKTICFRYFDDEGVATQKKYLFNKGVVSTYLYTLQTAAKAKANPTGNGYGIGSKASADVAYTYLKPGKKSEKELFEGIKEGVYITELSGLHSGMNAQSGNFSLQCAGFMIRDGKVAEPLALITVADNLINVFKNIKAVGNNIEFIEHNSMSCPSVLINKITIGGK